MKTFVLPNMSAAKLQKIDELKSTNPRFARVFHEYKLFSNQLWNLETEEGEEQIPDDFIDALQIQISALEKEISGYFADLPNA